jgi:hypothetical protein
MPKLMEHLAEGGRSRLPSLNGGANHAAAPSLPADHSRHYANLSR